MKKILSIIFFSLPLCPMSQLDLGISLIFSNTQTPGLLQLRNISRFEHLDTINDQQSNTSQLFKKFARFGPIEPGRDRSIEEAINKLEKNMPDVEELELLEINGDWLNSLARSSLAKNLRRLSIIYSTLPGLSMLEESIISRFSNLEEVVLKGFKFEKEELDAIAEKIASLKLCKKITIKSDSR